MDPIPLDEVLSLFVEEGPPVGPGVLLLVKLVDIAEFVLSRTVDVGAES